MKSRLPSIEEELKRLNEATISREKAFDRAKVNYDLLFAQLANRANREGSSQESSLNARIESLQMEKFALLKNVMELQQQAQLLSANISACNDKKRRLEQLVETLRCEKLDLENRIQGMQSENERLSRELEGIRELRLKRKRLNGDHNALKIPKIEMSVEENGCQESVSVSAEQVGQTAMDQVSDKLDVGARQVAEGEMTHRNHLLDDDAHEDGNGNQDSALFNNEYVDVKKEEEESLIGDDMGSDPEDSEYDANDASDSEEPLEGARQTSDGEMAQHDEEGNGNQDTALFNNEFLMLKKKKGVCSKMIWKVIRRTQIMTWTTHQISRSH
ncbi:hypothetical protein KIN20_013133 [Parelaphostrongylus tenuis]|uniref:Uncharacterized protein n=1 Tax=Parelaphostrongylus tenuis TaxID=148309 RepID=A0AAD5MD22_PARTN|nr:hypothetical protein KIN20_013133 [Parelaphostrongylus tenuis]